VSVEQAAGELMCSVAKISRMETAGRGVNPRDVRDLCRLYGVSDDIRDQLMQAAAEARNPGWWQEFPALDEPSTTFIGLESFASEIRTFEPLILPGLLQTKGYTQNLLPHLRPPGELDALWIKQTVAARARRQERVVAGDLALHAIIDEGVLRRPVGDPSVMVEQVLRLVDHARKPNVTLQIIPMNRGPHPGMEGSFQHLTFPDGQLADVVYVEGLLGTFLLDKQLAVDHYRVVFSDLSERFALPAEQTLSWLEALADHSDLSTCRRVS